MKVSFDFDSTLDRKDVQDFAKQLVNKGHEVWITTSRFDTKSALKKNWWWVEESNEKLYDVAESCGISKENITFTSMVNKIESLKGKGFTFHLDDDDIELEFIEESNDPCVGICVEEKNWKQNCEKLIG